MSICIIWQWWQMQAQDTKIKALKSLVLVAEDLSQKQTKQLKDHLDSTNNAIYNHQFYETKCDALEKSNEELKSQVETYKVYYEKYLELADDKTKILW